MILKEIKYIKMKFIKHLINLLRILLIHLFYVKKPTTIETLDENNNVISDASYNSGQFLHNRDLFPDKSFYSITVEGSDAENVLKVDRPDNRPGKGN